MVKYNFGNQWLFIILMIVGGIVNKMIDINENINFLKSDSFY